ncbi:MAG: peptidoglycan-binding protein [Treponema sp.]|jgi:hypothetical protein|nr:peptidoglycan-binding protein [Treponema sp.]
MRHVIDKIYDAMGEEEKGVFLQTLEKITIFAHLFFCSSCASEARKLDLAEETMRTQFFPITPSVEDVVMRRIEEIAEEDEVPEYDSSFRGWVVTGIIVLFSLSSVFFGMNFKQVAVSQGLSFIIPIGVTIGVALTTYSAVFIWSHLKELSERFGLR